MTPQERAKWMKEISERPEAGKNSLGLICALEWEQNKTERLTKDLETALREIEGLEDENKSLRFNLEQKSKEIGRAEHRGNTVDYIYDKCANYGRHFDELNKRITRLEKALECAKAALVRIEKTPEASYFETSSYRIANEALTEIARLEGGRDDQTP